ncbi:MAG TPA: TetR/AcrR family transcriptional regulator [Vicinamibacteria bacterium]
MTQPEVRSADRILLSALDLFSHKGYDATSVREICEAARITKPTLYHFYKSKDGLYRALVEGTLQEFKRRLVAELDVPGTAAERLKRVARLYFAQARGHRQLMRFLFALIHNPPATAPPTDFVQFYEEVVGRIAVCLEEAVARGELSGGRTDLRMLVLMGALGESLCGYVLTGRPELTTELADSLVETILGSWHPRR